MPGYVVVSDGIRRCIMRYPHMHLPALPRRGINLKQVLISPNSDWWITITMRLFFCRKPSGIGPFGG